MHKLTAAITAFMVVLVGAGIVSVYRTYAYPAVFSSNFRASCEQQGVSDGQCTCFLDTVKRMYSYSDARKFDESGQAPEALKVAVQVNCMQAK